MTTLTTRPAPSRATSSLDADPAAPLTRRPGRSVRRRARVARTAVRPAGVRRPAARRTTEGPFGSGARRAQRGVTCWGDVDDQRLLAARPSVRSARVALGADGRWDTDGRLVAAPLDGPAALPVQRRPQRAGVRSGSAAPSVRRAGPAAVRLTRRGRVVVLLVSLGIALAALTLIGPRSAASGDHGTPVQTRTVEVAPGDTLWSIASDVAAPGETRDLVHQIEELNAMAGPSVAVGQRIAVPVG